MTDFILLGNVGLIALPQYITEEDFIRITSKHWFYYNHYNSD